MHCGPTTKVIHVDSECMMLFFKGMQLLIPFLDMAADCGSLPLWEAEQASALQPVPVLLREAVWQTPCLRPQMPTQVSRW